MHFSVSSQRNQDIPLFRLLLYIFSQVLSWLSDTLTLACLSHLCKKKEKTRYALPSTTSKINFSIPVRRNMHIFAPQCWYLSYIQSRKVASAVPLKSRLGYKYCSPSILGCSQCSSGCFWMNLDTGELTIELTVELVASGPRHIML